MKTNYDKKQNIGMIALFVLSITLTAGLTAKLTKKANDNADKINQVNNNLSNEVDKLNQLVNQDKAVQLYGQKPGICMDGIDGLDSREIDFNASILTDYTMLYFDVHIDEGYINQYVMVDYLDLKEDGDNTNFYMLGGDQCGEDTDFLFGAIIRCDRDEDIVTFTFDKMYLGGNNYQYDRTTDTYKAIHENPNGNEVGGACHFECIYGIK